MKLQIKLEYLDNVYYSKTDDYTKEEFEEIIELIELCSKGQTNYLTFQSEIGKQFFSKEILKKSIITIIKK